MEFETIGAAKYSGIDKHGAQCDEIRPILQKTDPLFDIEFNYDRAEYIIYYNGGFFQATAFEDLDRECIRNIELTHWKNFHADIIAEVDEHNEKLKKREEAKQADIRNELAKDMYKAIQKDI